MQRNNTKILANGSKQKNIATWLFDKQIYYTLHAVYGGFVDTRHT